MTEYLLVESRDLLALPREAWLGDLMVALRQAGFPASVFLAEDAVLAARSGVSSLLDDLQGTQVGVVADGFCLEQRAVALPDVRSGVSVVEIEYVLQALERGARVLWR